MNNVEIQLSNWRSISIVITGLEYNEVNSLFICFAHSKNVNDHIGTM